MLSVEGEGVNAKYIITPSQFPGDLIEIKRMDFVDRDYQIEIRDGRGDDDYSITYLTDEEMIELFLAWAAIRWED